jgi:hypothetical protein
MELCAKQSCFADATDALVAASGAASEKANQHRRTVEPFPRGIQSENKPPRDENNATGSSVFCHSERSRGTCFLRSSNLALKALQPMFRVVARPNRNRLDVTATPPLRIARDCYVVPRRRTVDRFLIQLAAGESGYETPSDQDALEQ